ncbi:RepB family plasmid replication initiator protein [Pseudomonas aeruginosa]
MKTELVVKDNALINASYNLDLVEQRLILLAIVEARESGKGINANDPLTVHAESYINQFGVPAYQHVLATTDRLDVPVGRLYPHLSVASTAFPEGAGVGYHEPSAAILESMATCNHLHESEGNRIIVSAREKTPAYIRVRNKLCAGTERLTYEEWQILVNGTPKDIPSHLKVFPSPSVSGATQHE